jgi:hypothetical protein
LTRFFGVYGFEMTRPIVTDDVLIEPTLTESTAAMRAAQDHNRFCLTGFGKLEGSSDETLFDLAATMTFCQQQWVIVTGPFEKPADATLEGFRQTLPWTLTFSADRRGSGALIMRDVFSPESRKDFLKLCLFRLRDGAFLQSTGFREAFFRTVEALRMTRPYVDVTYYLYFSALEMMARINGSDFRSNFPPVAASFLQKLGFDVVEDDSSRRANSATTYARLRNALFHNGKFQAQFIENGSPVVLNLLDFEDYLNRLVPDVLLKVLGFDDGYINWKRWLDRMPFVAKP